MKSFEVPKTYTSITMWALIKRLKAKTEISGIHFIDQFSTEREIVRVYDQYGLTRVEYFRTLKGGKPEASWDKPAAVLGYHQVLSVQITGAQCLRPCKRSVRIMTRSK